MLFDSSTIIVVNNTMMHAHVPTRFSLLAVQWEGSDYICEAIYYLCTHGLASHTFSLSVPKGKS